MYSISLLQKAAFSSLFWLFCSSIATTAIACEFEIELERSCAEQLEEELMATVPFRVQRNSNFLHLQTQAAALAFPIFHEKQMKIPSPIWCPTCKLCTWLWYGYLNIVAAVSIW